MKTRPVLVVALVLALPVPSPAGGTPPAPSGAVDGSGARGEAEAVAGAPSGGEISAGDAAPSPFRPILLVPAPRLRTASPSGDDGDRSDDGPDLRASTWSPAQGEPVFVSFARAGGADNVSLSWKGRSYPMAPQGEGRFVGLVGVDLLDAPGKGTLAVEALRGGVLYRFEAEMEIAGRSFPVQRLTLPERMAVFDAPTLARIEREARALDERFDRAPGPPLWRIPFVTPVADFRPAGFGARRIINGEPRAPHAGVDVRLPEGTPVVAVADGVVAFAGEQFFGGKSVILDHGGGVFSVYYHLRDYLVADHPVDSAEEQRVSAGERIGSVGATGRAGGPHLHFAVRVPGGRIDPALLLGPAPR